MKQFLCRERNQCVPLISLCACLPLPALYFGWLTISSKHYYIVGSTKGRPGALGEMVCDRIPLVPCAVVALSSLLFFRVFVDPD